MMGLSRSTVWTCRIHPGLCQELLPVKQATCPAGSEMCWTAGSPWLQSKLLGDVACREPAMSIQASIKWKAKVCLASINRQRMWSHCGRCGDDSHWNWANRSVTWTKSQVTCQPQAWEIYSWAVVKGCCQGLWACMLTMPQCLLRLRPQIFFTAKTSRIIIFNRESMRVTMNIWLPADEESSYDVKLGCLVHRGYPHCLIGLLHLSINEVPKQFLVYLLKRPFWGLGVACGLSHMCATFIAKFT